MSGAREESNNEEPPSCKTRNPSREFLLSGTVKRAPPIEAVALKYLLQTWYNICQGNLKTTDHNDQQSNRG